MNFFFIIQWHILVINQELTIIDVIPLDKSKNLKFMSEYNDDFL